MEIYHRLRLFENISDNRDFPFISASLNITSPNADNQIRLSYATADSIYNNTNRNFETSWSHLRDAHDNICLRLYLYSDIANASIASNTRTPNMIVMPSQSAIEYCTHIKPYKVSDTYYLSFCGALPEYTTYNIPTGLFPQSASFSAPTNMNVDKQLASDMFTFIHGPFVRSIRNVHDVDIDGVSLNSPDTNIYHIGESHWIDVSKLTACDPTTFADPSYSKSISFHPYPEEWIHTFQSTDTSESLNLHIAERGDLDWIDYRSDALARADNGSIVYRPTISSTPCSDGYKVYISCIISNIIDNQTNNIDPELYDIISGTVWDWITVQIWEGKTYLSADCFIKYARGSENLNISFSNIYYNNNGVIASDEDALQKAENTIKAVWGHRYRVDVYAIVHADDAIICTTELASSLTYDTTWHNNYDTLFYINNKKTNDTKTLLKSNNTIPIDLTIQYKVYASTETPIKDSSSYTVGDKIVKDEFHYLTSIPIVSELFKQHKYMIDDNDPYTCYLVNEMYTGLKWDNVTYKPIPHIERYYTGETMVDANSIRIIGALATNSNYFQHTDFYGHVEKPSAEFIAVTDNDNTIAYYNISNNEPPLIVFEPNGYYLRDDFEWGYITRFYENGKWAYYGSHTHQLQQRKIGIHSNPGENVFGVCEDNPSLTADGHSLYKITDEGLIHYNMWYITHDDGGYNKGPAQCTISLLLATSDYKPHADASSGMTATDRATDVEAKGCSLLTLDNLNGNPNTPQLVHFRNYADKYILAFVKISSDVDDIYKAKVTDPVELGGSGYTTSTTPAWDASISSPVWSSYSFNIYFSRRSSNSVVTRGLLNTYHPSFNMLHSYWTSTGQTAEGHYGVDSLRVTQSKYPPVSPSTWKTRIESVNPIWPTDTNCVIDYAEDINGNPTTERLASNKNIQMFNTPIQDQWYILYADLSARNVVNMTSAGGYHFDSEVIKMTPATQQEESEYITHRSFDTKAFYWADDRDIITFRIKIPADSSLYTDTDIISVSKHINDFIAEGFTFDEVTHKYKGSSSISYTIIVPENETWRSNTGKIFYAGDIIDYVKYSGFEFVLI